jgi:UDP-N-acetylmuramate: L-alanyl-gamma-D-glutamyl-meso-diaminopimelate ligase
VNAKNFTSTNAIIEELVQKTGSGDVILIMSNGGFDGIYSKLMNAFKDL